MCPLINNDGTLRIYPQTTAHTLAFAFGLLALHPDYQGKLYKHTKSIIPDGQLLVVCLSLLLHGNLSDE